MKKRLFTLIFILITGLTNVAAEEALQLRSFSDSVENFDFCGIYCFKTDLGEPVELIEMNCFELENTLVSSIDALEEYEVKLANNKEQERDLENFSLSENFIPRIKNKLFLIQNEINLKCISL